MSTCRSESSICRTFGRHTIPCPLSIASRLRRRPSRRPDRRPDRRRQPERPRALTQPHRAACHPGRACAAHAGGLDPAGAAAGCLLCARLLDNQPHLGDELHSLLRRSHERTKMLGGASIANRGVGGSACPPANKRHTERQSHRRSRVVPRTHTLSAWCAPHTPRYDPPGGLRPGGGATTRRGGYDPAGGRTARGACSRGDAHPVGEVAALQLARRPLVDDHLVLAADGGCAAQEKARGRPARKTVSWPWGCG